MIVKSFKDTSIEIIITEAKIPNLYNITKITGNEFSDHQSMLDLESALDVFDIWLDSVEK